jgi:hypothetical protein
VSEVRRPLGLGVIAVLLTLDAIVSLVGAAVASGLLDAAIPSLEAAERPAAGIGYLILALAQLAVAWGFWTLRSWSWTIALLVSAFDILVGVIQLLLVGATGIGLQGLASIVVSSVVIAYLMRRNVLDAFVLRSLERMDDEPAGGPGR